MSVWDVLEDAAPTVFEALTGNIPAAAISAAALIAKEFGWKNKNPDAVKQQLQTLTPEQQLKFGELELQFEQLQNDNDALVVGDVQNARGTQVKLVQAGVKDYTPNVLSYIAVIGFWASLFMLWLLPLSADTKSIVLILIGTVVRENIGVYAFWIGTSKSSRDKSDFIQSQFDKD